VTGGWRKLYKEKRHTLYSTKYCYDDQTKKGDIDRKCRRRGEMRNAYKILAGKPDRKDVSLRTWAQMGG
jgi:hypothetical protein